MSNVFDGLASGYDIALMPLEWAVMRRLRRRAFAGLEGRILELGTGTGINLPLYGSGARVVALDASPEMLKHAARRRPSAQVWLVQADAHRLPFASGAFDTVTGSLVFCSLDEPAGALDEIRRVMRDPTPDEDHAGRLVLIEHTRGEGRAAWITDRLNPLWTNLTKSCRLNRQTVSRVIEAGFRLVRLETRLGIFQLIEGAK